MAEGRSKKTLPWGLTPDTIAPGSMKTISDSKLKAFQTGRNPLKGKAPSKQKEEEKKKAEEAAAAEVYAEYIASFQNAGAVGKTFVKGNVINSDKTVESTQDSGRLHVYKPKPTSKLEELANEFKKHKEPTVGDTKLDLKKKKDKEKKKSNLELFKEELEKQQKEREIRHKIKQGDLSGISSEVLASLPSSFFKTNERTDDDFSYNYGSHDTGDPSTTNLYIGNINPKMNEEQLCKVFGKFGPLASVKIMWPRTEEERARNRNCGFVAYMNRKDGEKALKDLIGKDIMGYEMKLGWGKAVPIPPQPIYVPPEMVEAQQPPPPSGLPFNAQIPSKYKGSDFKVEGNLEKTVVKVVIPTERNVLSLINRTCEFVVREGPMFEAMIMNRELHNPMFRFMFDNKCPEHVYYRWRIFSLLQGDTPQKWNQLEFRMFIDGSIWKPPPMNPYGSMPGNQTTSQVLASASSAIVHSAMTFPKGEEKEEPKKEEKDTIKKGRLSDRNRDKLEDLLRTVTTERPRVAELMVWCLDHADCADEIIDCITESLSLVETPIQTKIARLFVVSDILHNSSAKIPNASYFRRGDKKKAEAEKIGKVLKRQAKREEIDTLKRKVEHAIVALKEGLAKEQFASGTCGNKIKEHATKAAAKEMVEKEETSKQLCLYEKMLEDEFETRLTEVMKHMRTAFLSLVTKNQTEKFRKQILSCLAAWQDWSIYTPGYLITLQNIFVGLADSSASKETFPLTKDGDEELDGFPLAKEDSDIDGAPLPKVTSDLDGVPLISDIDGISLVKSSDLDGEPLATDDIDGIPLSKGEDNLSGKSKWERGKWESADISNKRKRSRWDPDEEAGQMPKSKWEAEETSVPKSRWDGDEAVSPTEVARTPSERLDPLEVSTKSETQGEKEEYGSPEEVDRPYEPSSVSSSSSILLGEVDESRRRFLREVELKVVKFADKLEAAGGLKSGRTVQEECERFRSQLIRDYEKARKRKLKERRKDRSRSKSPITPKRKKAHRSSSPSRSLSPLSLESISSDDDSKSARRKSRRSPKSRSRSPSRSPSPRRSSSKKKKKKSSRH